MEISKLTWEKADAAKKYIENKYAKIVQQEKTKFKQWQFIIEKMTALNLSIKQKQQIKQEIFTKEAELMRKQRALPALIDYELKDIIGRGSFGEVRLCRDRKTNELVAIKRMKKLDMIARNQIGHVNVQKQVLSMTDTSYLVQLKCSFQDQEYLYIVMQYLAGGDFMNLLIERDVLEEEQVKFYMAELVLAVEQIHNLGYIHRDIKPDNILIAENGHIKLTDFGLSRQYGEAKLNKLKLGMKAEFVLTNLGNARRNTNKRINFDRKKLYSKVGTPEYIAPEVLNSDGYDQLVDSWSIGVIFYESLVGYTPFCSQDSKAACKKIMNWKYFFEIPDEVPMSIEAKHLILSLICEKERRLTIKGIKQHPFFRDIIWKHLEHYQPPSKPLLGHPEDTSNFEVYQQIEPWVDKQSELKHKDFNFTAFNFKKQKKESIVDIAESRIQKIKKQRLSCKPLKENSSLHRNTSFSKKKSCIINTPTNKKPVKKQLKKIHMSRLKTVNI